MARKATPIITNTEILSRAIISIQTEIDEWRELCNGLPKEQADTSFDAATKALRDKLDAVKIMYRIETGSDFD